MAFTIGPDGTLWILDQVNGRLLKLRPGQTKPEAVKLSLLAPQDVKVAADGTVVVLDRLGDRAIALIGADGEPLGTLPLTKIKDTGGVTGVFTDENDIYIEREHGALTLVGTTKGVSAAMPHQILGRPTPDGSAFLHAALAERAGVVVNVFDRKTQAQRFTRLLSFSEPIQYLLELDADRVGTLYVAAVVGIPGSAHIVVTCLSLRDGASIGRAHLQASELADEVFREIAINPDGGFVHNHRSESGARYEQHTCAP